MFPGYKRDKGKQKHDERDQCQKKIVRNGRSPVGEHSFEQPPEEKNQHIIQRHTVETRQNNHSQQPFQPQVKMEIFPLIMMQSNEKLVCNCFQADIQAFDLMGKGAHGDKIHSCFGIGPDSIGGNTP